ncbi:ARM repeat fold domain containing protein [Acanthamoeba castellanii str. Neff]|uniref:ARM repeat fold domain containing protein n=1 Tax=Acanthamoeba castellanii (strain ATCC 30010 / Neff) TaxID=1257118 RepID=L8HAR0_ACACF|nr:ARM repeat fold domain containing protein [Acanthamoeba castellanii str. Neff]ELR22342.1 ARM repeat fold domain containing protein [Acanthamoeba castellanii str. Neff]
MNPNSIDAGLLRFCLEHSDGGNLTETQLPQRDEADYKWLRAALNDLQTDADRMKKLVEMLKSSESSETDKATALEELQYLIEDLDNANDLYKIGGFEPVLALMNDKDSANLRYWAAWAVATAVQNNPSSQAQAMEKGALAQILLLLQNETEDRVLSKAVPALSGLIRDHPKAVEAFLKANGLRLLAYLLTSTKGDQLSAATKMKVVFLFAYLCRVVPLVRHAVREYSLIKPLADMVARSDSADLREKALACLLEATKDTGLNVEACRELGLPETLKDRIASTKGDEDKQTEHDLCLALNEQLSSQAQRTDK